MSKAESVPLPVPAFSYHSGAEGEAFTADQMRAYGSARAAAALELLREARGWIESFGNTSSRPGHYDEAARMIARIDAMLAKETP